MSVHVPVKPVVDPLLAIEIASIFAAHYDVIVHNDDVTTFETVIAALVSLFGHSRDRAEQLAWVVHRTGSAVVATLPKPEAEEGVTGLHARGITASMRPSAP